MVAKVFPVFFINVMLNGKTDFCRTDAVDNLDSLRKFLARLV